MPLSDQARIAADAATPRIVELWQALQPLKSVISFMQSGAHPDDETSAMMAALTYRDGFGISYACAVRGEGGQNDIGTEIGEDLGVLRTAEMERAADVLGMTLYWLSQDPEDSIFDFGLSKSGVETLDRWGEDRVMQRFVEIVRTERPDILCPTFLDIPGQHGHHRAMTHAAHQVFDAAADPDFPCALPAWQIKKLFLPAWSGAGGSYDDEVPPPPATVTVPVRGRDPVTGWSWERIGQQSRAFHRTQGMGRWVTPEAEQDRPLHLARSSLVGAGAGLGDGLALDLCDLADGAGAAAGPLQAAGKAMDGAVAAFPEFGAVLDRAVEALAHLRRARTACPAEARGEVLHRLDRKEAQLGRVIRLAAGVEVIGHVAQDWLRPGALSKLRIETRNGNAETVEVHVDLPPDWRREDDRIGPGPDCAPSDPYPPVHRSLAATAPALRVSLRYGGEVSETVVPLLVRPVVLPDRSAALTPERAVLNTALSARSVVVDIAELSPADARATLGVPENWTAHQNDRRWTLVAPDDLAEGLYDLPLALNARPAVSLRRIACPHVAPRLRTVPAALKVRAVNAALAPTRIGYIGGGSDRVGHWLAELGADVTAIGDAELGDTRALAGFDTLVIGIFAMRFRAGLLAAMPALHGWVAAGGTLVTLYHRPWDNWDPDSVPPKRLEIGQPSLRWRVTDETAPVTHLVPEHPLLTWPNAIDPSDWDGWHKERGLYFAKSWDAAYVPLLAMADPGEAPHRGALLSAEIGKGRHTHCALILHHQMEKLTPGAFRLMANLVAPRQRAG
ncbi:MAG: PIG-L family deacetylase [Rhodobacter sp.]|nr:PIG-L family deacetylase [Rhodobacter sp.]